MASESTADHIQFPAVFDLESSLPLHPASVLSTCESVSCFYLRHIRRAKLYWLRYLLTQLWRLKEDRFAGSFLLSLPSPSWPLHDSFWRNREKRDKSLHPQAPTLERETPTPPRVRITFEIFSKLALDSQAAITEPFNQIWGRPLFLTELWLQVSKD